MKKITCALILALVMLVNTAFVPVGDELPEGVVAARAVVGQEEEEEPDYYPPPSSYNEQPEPEEPVAPFALPQDFMDICAKLGVKATWSNLRLKKVEYYGAAPNCLFDITISSPTLGELKFTDISACYRPDIDKHYDSESAVSYMGATFADDNTLAVTMDSKVHLYNVQKSFEPLCILDFTKAEKVSTDNIDITSVHNIISLEQGYIVILQDSPLSGELLFDKSGKLAHYSLMYGSGIMYEQQSIKLAAAYEISPGRVLVETVLTRDAHSVMGRYAQAGEAGPLYVVELENNKPKSLSDARVTYGPIENPKNKNERLLMLTVTKWPHDMLGDGKYISQKKLALWTNSAGTVDVFASGKIENPYGYEMDEPSIGITGYSEKTALSAFYSSERKIQVDYPDSGARYTFDFENKKILYYTDYELFDVGKSLDGRGGWLDDYPRTSSDGRFIMTDINFDATYSYPRWDVVAYDTQTGKVHDFGLLGTYFDCNFVDDRTLLIDSPEKGIFLYDLIEGKRVDWGLKIPSSAKKDYLNLALLKEPKGSRTLLIGEYKAKNEYDNLSKYDCAGIYTIFLFDKNGELLKTGDLYMQEVGYGDIFEDDIAHDRIGDDDILWRGDTLIVNRYLEAFGAFDLKSFKTIENYDGSWIARDVIDKYVANLEALESSTIAEDIEWHEYDPLYHLRSYRFMASNLPYLMQKINNSETPYRMCRDNKTGIYATIPRYFSGYNVIKLGWAEMDANAADNINSQDFAAGQSTAIRGFASIPSGKNERLVCTLTDQWLLMSRFDLEDSSMLEFDAWTLDYNEGNFENASNEYKMALFFGESVGSNLRLVAHEDKIEIMNELDHFIATITVKDKTVFCK